jgi:hypothetical protein
VISLATLEPEKISFTNQPKPYPNYAKIPLLSSPSISRHPSQRGEGLREKWAKRVNG